MIILLHKLYNYGMRGIAHDLFTNYLHNRKQCTVVGSSNLSRLQVNCGITETISLRTISLLFLFYVNDVANAIPGEQVKLICC